MVPGQNAALIFGQTVWVVRYADHEKAAHLVLNLGLEHLPPRQEQSGANEIGANQLRFEPAEEVLGGGSPGHQTSPTFQLSHSPLVKRMRVE
jgi:hypothetical protein